jgi:hypothetical protein
VFHRPAAIAAGARCDRSVVWVLNQRLARKLAVGASAAGLFDQLGAVKTDVVPDFAQHRGRDLDPAA